MTYGQRGLKAEIFCKAGTTRANKEDEEDFIYLAGGCSELIIVNIDAEFHKTDGLPLAMIVEGRLAGQRRVVPAQRTEGGYEPILVLHEPYGQAVFGGAYVYSDDRRFGPQELLPLHDLYVRQGDAR